MPVSYSSEVLQAIAQHLERSYPCEGCGVVVERGTDLQVIPMLNAVERQHPELSARTAYEMDPSELLHVFSREQVVCIFHSHVNSSSLLSWADREQALCQEPLFPGVEYLLASVLRGRATDLRVYRWQQGDFREEQLAWPQPQQPSPALDSG